MTQRTTEWLDVTASGPAAYHRRQFDRPYRSTEAFGTWLDGLVDLRSTPQRVVDIGCGEGANAFHLSRRYPATSFVGIELNERLVDWGNELLVELGATEVQLQQGDLYSLDPSLRSAFDGLISLQTLSWLPDFDTPVRRMMELKPEWIAVSSLFFEGKVNARIEIQDYSLPLAGKPYREAYYNVYSIPLVEDVFREGGYKEFRFQPFEIDIDLPAPEDAGMGTYTEQLADGRRLQISGPLLMNWYFLFARRSPATGSTEAPAIVRPTSPP